MTDVETTTAVADSGGRSSDRHRDPARIDWAKLARRLQDVQAQMIHHDPVQRYGDDFYAEALRRVFGYASNDGADGRRQLPYESVSASTGLMTTAEADYLREGHTIIDRLNAERAQQEAKEARAETRRILRDAARDLAKLIRSWANERTVPSRYRREGVLIAADWIDPDSPATPHNYEVPEAPAWPREES